MFLLIWRVSIALESMAPLDKRGVLQTMMLILLDYVRNNRYYFLQPRPSWQNHLRSNLTQEPGKPKKKDSSVLYWSVPWTVALCPPAQTFTMFVLYYRTHSCLILSNIECSFSCICAFIYQKRGAAENTHCFCEDPHKLWELMCQESQHGCERT